MEALLPVAPDTHLLSQLTREVGAAEFYNMG